MTQNREGIIVVADFRSDRGAGEGRLWDPAILVADPGNDRGTPP